jgi:uncharacterized protein YrrD
MKYKDGMNVYSSGGEKVGEVNRVVVDPGEGSVTHIVVRKGFLFTEDRVVPVDMIGRSDDEEIHLNVTEDRLEELPEFIEVNYMPVGEPGAGPNAGPQGAGTPTELYWYPMAGTSPLMWGGGHWGVTPEATGYYYPHQIRTEQNIPEGHIALEEGANVIDREGEKVGDVAQVISEPDGNKVTHLVITKGFLNQEKKLIPANWISRVKDDTIQLKVDSKFIEKLRDYKED